MALISRNLGRDIQLASGISPDDRIIVAPPDGIADGNQVRIASGVKAGDAAKASANVRKLRFDLQRGNTVGAREQEKTRSCAGGDRGNQSSTGLVTSLHCRNLEDPH